MGGGSGNFLGGGATGYAPISQRFEAPTPQRTASPQPSSLRSPAFKSGGMKLGSKKTKQAELLDALGGELAVEEQSAPASPVQAPEPVTPAKDYTSSLPAVAQERRVRILSSPWQSLTLSPQRSRRHQRNRLGRSHARRWC